MATLQGVSENFISFMVKQREAIDLNWIGDIIKFLIEGVGITAVGVILFTLILKTIVLPLDIFSKFKTKKAVADYGAYAPPDGEAAKTVRQR